MIIFCTIFVFFNKNKKDTLKRTNKNAFSKERHQNLLMYKFNESILLVMESNYELSSMST